MIPGLDRESEFDSYDPITGELEDYKTAGDWRWDVLGQEGPDEEVWGQVMLYALALIAMGRTVRTVKLSYIKRCNGHDETFVRDYDEVAAKAWLDVLLGYATTLDMIKDAQDSGADEETLASLALPRKYLGPSADEMCRRCFARIHCWNMNEAAALGRSPESLTILGEQPDDESVIWAIAEKIEASAEEKAAKDRVTYAKTLLEGVEPGRYGDFEGYRKGGGGGPNYKGRAEQLEEYFDLPEAQRPPLGALEAPKQYRYTFTQWGKVRKATL